MAVLYSGEKNPHGATGHQDPPDVTGVTVAMTTEGVIALLLTRLFLDVKLCSLPTITAVKHLTFLLCL